MFELNMKMLDMNIVRENKEDVNRRSLENSIKYHRKIAPYE